MENIEKPPSAMWNGGDLSTIMHFTHDRTDAYFSGEIRLT